MLPSLPQDDGHDDDAEEGEELEQFHHDGEREDDARDEADDGEQHLPPAVLRDEGVELFLGGAGVGGEARGLVGALHLVGGESDPRSHGGEEEDEEGFHLSPS